MLSSIYGRRMPRYGARRTMTRRQRRGEPVRTIDVGLWAAATRTSARTELGPARASIAVGADANLATDDIELSAPEEAIAIDWRRLEAAGHSPSDQQLAVLRAIAAPLLAGATGPAHGWRERTVLFTSPEPSAGSAVAATSLALALAADHDVLLVDGDPTGAAVSAWFGASSRPGLSNALADPHPEPEPLIARTEVGRLALLASGPARPDLLMLLARPTTATLIRALPGADRVVLIAGPPLSRIEGRALALFAGQIVLVVQAGETPKGAIEAALERLGDGANRYLLLNGAVRTEAMGDR